MNSPAHASSTYYRYRSPLGMIGIEVSGATCIRLFLKDIDAPICSPDHPAAAWLRGYFAGKRLPLPELGQPHSAFQARLRKALLAIPKGEVRTYGELASQLGSSPRAVGQALGANPLPILVPCHRVVASDGLGGFSGGLDWKSRLLAFEKANLPENPSTATGSRQRQTH